MESHPGASWVISRLRDQLQCLRENIDAVGDARRCDCACGVFRCLDQVTACQRDPAASELANG